MTHFMIYHNALPFHWLVAMWYLYHFANYSTNIKKKKKFYVQETTNLLACVDGSTKTKWHNQIWNTQLPEDLSHRGTPYSLWTCPTAEHPTYRGPAPPQNTLLTAELPQRGTPYSLWTYSTSEHPTHLGPSPPLNTLITEDLPHSGKPFSGWTYLDRFPTAFAEFRRNSEAGLGTL